MTTATQAGNPRRRYLRILAGATLLPGSFARAQSPQWPQRPVRIIVTFPPGGSSDVAARLIAQPLSDALGQPVIIENRPGAGGGLGIELVARSTADGYTLVLTGAGGLTANPTLYRKLNYDPVRDLAPIGTVGTSPFVVIANAAFPATGLAEALALARARPGALNYGSGGNGTAMHLTGEMLKLQAGVDIRHIPYRGLGPAVIATMGGETELAVADVASVREQLAGGRIKALAVTSHDRSPLIPQLPTVAESGIKGFDASGWFALLAPTGTSADVVERISNALNVVLRDDEIRRRFADTGLQTLPGSPGDLAELMRTETAKWAEVIRRSGATVD